MTREIKFRYWNVGRRVMIENVGFHPHILMNIDAMEDWEEEYKPDSPGSIIRNEKSEHGILMQFTGIKDIHGVEIYEGDIIKIKDTNLKTNVLSVVRWDAATFSYQIQHPTKQWGGNDIINIIEYDGEVIGNIYQNPDLIKTLNVEE